MAFSICRKLARTFCIAAFGAGSLTVAVAQDTPFSFVDDRGSTYQLIDKRQVSSGLRGTTVKIESPEGRLTVMEVLHRCQDRTFAYAGMTFGDGPFAKSDMELATEVTGYTDVDLSSRLRAKDYFPIDEMGMPADKALFDLACEN